MTTKLESQGKLEGKHCEDVHWQIDQIQTKHDKYVAHLVRGTWEINNKNNIFRNLPVGHVIEVQDWKMKFIMLLFREVRSFVAVKIVSMFIHMYPCRRCQISLANLATPG